MESGSLHLEIRGFKIERRIKGTEPVEAHLQWSSMEHSPTWSSWSDTYLSFLFLAPFPNMSNKTIQSKRPHTCQLAHSYHF